MKKIFVLFLLFIPVTQILSQAGTLDNSFDGDGIVTTAISATNDFAESIAIQTDGRIVTAGYSISGINFDFAVVRYNSDGSLDTGFDGDGKVTTGVGTSNDQAFSVAIQTDGKIVVAGYSFMGSNNDFSVVRYNSDGSLDASFDGDGKVTTAIGASNDEAYSVAIQNDGKIVVAGRSHNGSNYVFAVVRYNSDGSLDTGFDGDGKVTTSIGAFFDEARSVVIQNDGKIVVAGRSQSGVNNVFAVVRYNNDGSLDTGFDSDGKVTTAIGSHNDQAYSAAMQSDGKIIVAGYSFNGINYDFAAVRYNEDGSLDTGFDGDGKVTTSVGSGFFNFAYSAAIQNDGKIVLAGPSFGGGNWSFAVVRYNSDGSLDTGFDVDGIVTTVIGSTDNKANSVAIQSDGKIVVAGYSHNGSNYDFAVVRYLGDAALSIEQQLNVISTQILDYVDTGILSYGNGNALISKLNSALNKINDGNTNAAVNQLNAFINQVNAFINSGKLTPEQGQSLINSVNEVISELNNLNKQGIEISELPTEYIMLQNYPNPFNPSTVIKYSLPDNQRVLLRVYDILGREVATLVNEFQEAGSYEANFNASHLSSGLYLYKISATGGAGEFTAVKKMILTK